ncbi:hypothetical protein KYD80_26120 [Escherichia coli]|nr:hypothetical protein [Escherichia coli]MBW1225686.1 hypothetical protein [Escherichia coli]
MNGIFIHFNAKKNGSSNNAIGKIKKRNKIINLKGKISEKSINNLISPNPIRCGEIKNLYIKGV